MPAPKKYDAETQDRAVRMYRDRIHEHGDSKAPQRRRRDVEQLADVAQG